MRFARCSATSIPLRLIVERGRSSSGPTTDTNDRKDSSSQSDNDTPYIRCRFSLTRTHVTCSTAYIPPPHNSSLPAFVDSSYHSNTHFFLRLSSSSHSYPLLTMSKQFNCQYHSPHSPHRMCSSTLHSPAHLCHSLPSLCVLSAQPACLAALMTSASV